MTKRCEIIAYSVPVPYTASGNIPTNWPTVGTTQSNSLPYNLTTMAAQHQCNTHQWTFQLGLPPPDHGMCPLGRIEDATDNALEMIKQAT